MRIRLAPVFLVLLAAAPAMSATYYVRTDGNDSADGRTHQTAWASVGKVNGYAFAPGDVVLFHEGQTWKGTPLAVSWGGTDGAHAVVGAYYLDNGESRRGFRGRRPTIDGGDRVPASEHEGLIEVRAPRVRIENLAVANAEGRGVNFHESPFPQAVNLTVENVYSCGISLIRSDDGLIEGNHVQESDRKQFEDGKNWCAGIAAVRSARAVVRGNTVEKVYGEGINANHDSRDALIEDNFVFAARAVGIYADAAPRPTIRRNIVVGTADSRYWRGGKTVGGGIVLSNEVYHYRTSERFDRKTVQTKQAKVYGNLVAFTSQGIGIWGGELDESSFDGTFIYNNTLVDNDYQLRTRGKPMPGSVFANNILLSLSAGTADVLDAPSGLVGRNNYFSKGDPGGALRHGGNLHAGAHLNRMNGWRNIRSASEVSWRDFAPKEVSSTNGKGDASHLGAASVKDSFALDFNASPHNTPLDLGALRFLRVHGKIPMGPKALGTGR